MPWIIQRIIQRLAVISLLPLGVVLLCSGCQRFFNDAPKPTAPLDLSAGASACIQPALKTFETFYEGHAKPLQIEAAWNCGSNAIERFLGRFRGRESGSYSVDEVRAFLQDYLLGSVQVSDALLNQAMKLKQALLGGTVDRVTHQDLRRAQATIESLKAESLKLAPFMGLLTMVDDPADYDARQEFVAGAARQLVVSSHAFSQMFAKAQGDYSLKDAEVFLRELAKIYALNSSGWNGTEWFTSRLATISTLKTFFVKPNGDRIEGSEWQPLIANAGRLFGVFVQYRYGLRGRDMLTGRGLATLITTMNDLFDSLDEAVHNKPDGIVSWAAIDPLIHVVYSSGALKMPLTEPTVVGLLRPLIRRVFNPRWAEYGGRVTADGLTIPVVEQMRRDFMGWADMQRMWDDLETRAVAGEDGRYRFKEIISAWDAIESKYDDKEDLARLFKAEHPLAFAPAGTVIFDRDTANLTLDRESFTSLNWKRLLIRGAIRGFASNPSAARWTGLTFKEFGDFFYAMRAFAVELRLVGPEDERSWQSSFREADVFLFTSDGNGKIDFDEGVSLISVALSGSKMSRLAYREMRTFCPNYEVDVFELPKLDLKCFQDRLRYRFSTYFASLPEWTNATSSLSGEEGWRNLTRDIVKAIRRPAKPETLLRGAQNGERIESADFDRMVMIAQYIECFFIRYDVDGNGVIDAAEARVAFQVFKRMLSGLSGYEDEQMNWKIFAYLLATGSPPPKVSLPQALASSSALHFYFWGKFLSDQGRVEPDAQGVDYAWKYLRSGFEKGWNIHANRLFLFKIVGAFEN